MDIFQKLIQTSGAYNLPFLVTLHDSDNETVLRYVNNDTDVTYDGETYSAAAFSYTPNTSVLGFDGGGSLQIAAKDAVIAFGETYRTIYLDVVGAMLEDGTVTEIKKYSHHYGKLSCSGMKITFTFNKDDRLDMTFPALIFSAYNNRGN